VSAELNRKEIQGNILHREEVQGNILRGYRRAIVRHLILEVPERAAAQKFFAASVEHAFSDFRRLPQLPQEVVAEVRN
jgi:hypothetical protein